MKNTILKIIIVLLIIKFANMTGYKKVSSQEKPSTEIPNNTQAVIDFWWKTSGKYKVKNLVDKRFEKAEFQKFLEDIAFVSNVRSIVIDQLPSILSQHTHLFQPLIKQEIYHAINNNAFVQQQFSQVKSDYKDLLSDQRKNFAIVISNEKKEIEAHSNFAIEEFDKKAQYLLENKVDQITSNSAIIASMEKKHQQDLIVLESKLRHEYMWNTMWIAAGCIFFSMFFPKDSFHKFLKKKFD